MHTTLPKVAERGMTNCLDASCAPADLGPNGKKLSVAVVVASLGRPDLLRQMSDIILRQTLRPDALIFSVVGDEDLPSTLHTHPSIQVLKGPRGLCAQRNTALAHLGNRFDIIVFYDDDFVPASNSIARIVAFFATHEDVIAATGHVIADGINTAGIDFTAAQAILHEHDKARFTPNCIVTDLFGLYGCNMVYRASAIRDTRFDERLKLYGWQEDIDFTGALLGRGRIVKTFAFSGVHQGIKVGRTPGVRLGYSQVVNPAYLARKGTMRLSFALKLVLRNLLANHLKSFRQEPWIDRRGRTRGNWIGLVDVLRGRLTPERIETL